MTAADGSGRRARTAADSPAEPLQDEHANPGGQPPLSPVPPAPADARSDWFARIGRRSTVAADAEEAALRPPRWLEAESGRAQVTLRWERVEGAIGYLVHRAASADGPFQTVDHGSGDLLSVPHMPYADTTGTPGVAAWYAVSSLASVEQPTGPLSPPRRATPLENGGGEVRVVVNARAGEGRLGRPWRPIIGSERLSLLCRDRGVGGSRAGEEIAAALRLARSEIGVRFVRAHAILHDELSPVRRVDGVLEYDFGRVDEIYDRLLALGLRPVVELSFMPGALAREPGATVFDYRAIVSEPRDFAEWGRLIEAFVAHLVARYGIEEVAGWAFEVWNEPNLQVFWSGTQADYFRLYEAAARAVKSVDPRLRVGGPASAAAGWVSHTLEWTAATGVPLDFLSTHSYGNPPLDLHEATAAAGRRDLPIWWTEWGVTPVHFAPVNDSVFGAPFILRSMKLAGERGIASLAYWVVSDHFEELGEPARLFHGGFGLLSVGNLRKPRYWALALLERMADRVVASFVRGDGADGLVEALATRDEAGELRLLVWNGTLDQSKIDGDARLARRIELEVRGLGDSPYELRHFRLDEGHSNIVRVWDQMARSDWPDEAGWRLLRERDRLDELEPQREVTPAAGCLEIAFELPMPGVSFLTLTPTGR